MKAGTAWLSMGERGSVLGIRLILLCYRILGRRACSYLLLPVVAYFFVTGRLARRASHRYLRRLHGWANGAAEGRRPPNAMQSFRHFYEFALNIVDRVSFFVGDTRDFKTIVHGREHVERLTRDKRGALVLSAHLGSFDALRLWAEQSGAAVSVAMFLRNARMINAVFEQLNPALRMRVIDLGRTAPRSVLDIRACIQRGEFVGLLADRVGVADGDRISWVPFLGARAAISHGPFLLAAALHCPVLFMIGLRVDDTTYEIFVETLAEEVVLPATERTAALDGLACAYGRRLEQYCLRAPYQWFNFYDFWDELAPSTT
jgi:predicted LPLAT superfamily acyltransferase